MEQQRKHSHGGNKTFPRWEAIIPTAGISGMEFFAMPLSFNVQFSMFNNGCRQIRDEYWTTEAGY